MLLGHKKFEYNKWLFRLELTTQYAPVHGFNPTFSIYFMKINSLRNEYLTGTRYKGIVNLPYEKGISLQYTLWISRTLHNLLDKLDRI